MGEASEAMRRLLFSDTAGRIIKDSAVKTKMAGNENKRIPAPVLKYFLLFLPPAKNKSGGINYWARNIIIGAVYFCPNKR